MDHRKDAGNPRVSDFNAGWRFLRGVSNGAQEPAFDDSHWRDVTLPHDFGVEGAFTRLARSTVGFLRTGEGWYRKSFDAPASWRCGCVYLDFDGAMAIAEVWLNGVRLAEHHNGYAPFRVDLTGALNWGGANVIAVHTNTPEPCSRWYPGAGLYRAVRLVVTGPVHVAHWGVRISTPTLETDMAAGRPALVRAETWIDNESAIDAELTLRSEVIDADGSVVARTETALDMPAGSPGVPRPADEPDRGALVGLPSGPAQAVQEIAVPGPHLWSTADPYRYTLRTTIVVDGGAADAVETPFGLRWIGMSSETGLSLNGVRMKIAGMCMHHDLGALGAAVNRRAIVRQLEILKDAGVNAIRTAHNIGSKVQIEEASRMGFLVLEELADMWTAPKDRNDYSNYFLADSATDLEAMIGRDRNEPSVFMWSLGNEVAWQESELPLAERLVATAHAADPTRPVCVNDSSYLSKGIDGIGDDIHERMDVRGYSYAAERYLVAIHDKHPDDLIINSESGCSLGSRGWYAYPTDVPEGVRGTEFPFEPGRRPWDPDTYEITAYDATANRGTPIRKDFMRSMELDFHMGEFTWTGFDYIGEPAPYIGNFYWNDPSQTESDGTVLAPKTAYYGIVDSAGFPKDEWHLYRSLWRDPDDAPMVHLLPHWNWREGEPVQVWAYSNAASVELFLNGRSLGVRAFEPHDTGFHLDPAHADKPFQYRLAKDDPNKAIHLTWDVRFEPGTLVAVARDAEGREVARDEVSTAGSPAAIRLTPDRHVIRGKDAGDRTDLDLSFVTADIVDAAGRICPNADDRLVFHAEHGVILGTDNGYQASTEPFQDPRRKAYHGKALAIVAPDGSGLPIRVTAHAIGAAKLRDGGTTVAVTDGDPERTDEIDATGPDPIETRPAWVRTPVGHIPELPAAVDEPRTDGTIGSVAVAWSPIAPASVARPGSLTVDGIAADGLAARAVVTVTEPVAVMPVALAVPAGKDPAEALPARVAVVHTDGSETAEPVVWPAIDHAALADGTTAIIHGTLLGDARGSGLKAVARVRALKAEERARHGVALADLRVNGVTVDGFEPGRRHYAVTLPYDASAPAIEAEGADGAAVAVIPPATGAAGTYLVDIVSEDGRRGETVDVTVTIPPAPIATVGLIADRTDPLEDGVVRLAVTARDVLGDPIDPKALDVTVTSSDPAVAAVDRPAADGGVDVRATLAGTAAITATASYAGGRAVSDPLVLTVRGAGYRKQPIGVDEVILRCETGQTPDLPERVTVHFNRGFDAAAPVSWQADPALWREPGVHVVHGDVAGLGLTAYASVTVASPVAVERVAAATVTGIAPDLAETAPEVRVWWSDGAVDRRPVVWDSPDDSAWGRPGMVTVTGAVGGIGLGAEAHVRVTDEHVTNRDLFSFRNDVYPTVDASYTNADPKVMEDVSNLMDGTISYTARAGYNLKNRWSTLDDPSREAWLEYRFGYGTETAFMLNSFTVYYCLEGNDGDAQRVALPESVRVKAWDGDSWTDVRGLEHSDRAAEQSGAAGWIYGSFGDRTASSKVDRGVECTYTFDMVKTSRIRIEFTSRPGECVAITEIRGDAQVPAVHEDCALASLSVDGEPVALEPGADVYVVRRKAAGAPRIEAEPAGNNAAVTVIPPVGGGDGAHVAVTAENGVATRLITLRLQ